MTLISTGEKAIILVPTFSEKENIVKLVARIQELPYSFDILIIDDDSPDGTGEVADGLAKKFSSVHVLHRQKKEGLGKAYLDGFRWALERSYDLFIQMDADLSHEPSALPRFMEAIQNYDAVFGSRYNKGVRVHNWSFSRLLLSKFSNVFISKALGLSTTDTTTAFKCFRRSVLESIPLDRFKGRQNAFLIELVYAVEKSGFRTTEIPFTFYERETGESKMNPKVALESLGTVFRLLLFGRNLVRSK